MTDSPTVRVAEPEDAVRLLELWARAAFGRSVSDDEASAQRLLAHPTTKCFVVDDDDGAIVGSLIAGWDGWRFCLYRLAVDPARRRRHHATELLAAAERFALEVGAKRLDAIVDTGNEEGEAFWASQRFRPHPEYVRFERPVRGTATEAPIS